MITAEEARDQTEKKWAALAQGKDANPYDHCGWCRWAMGICDVCPGKKPICNYCPCQRVFQDDGMCGCQELERFFTRHNEAQQRYDASSAKELKALAKEVLRVLQENRDALIQAAEDIQKEQ